MISRIRSFVFLLVLSLLAAPAYSTNAAVDGSLDNAQLVGEARLKVMFWDVFDASLYSESGVYRPDEPFALTLRYLRSIDREKIVAKSIEEIQRQDAGLSDEQLTRWQRELSQIIPDVREGSTITGVRTDDGFTVFYANGQQVGSIDDGDFTRAFFDIWLGEKSSEQKLRFQLLGGAQDT